MPSFRVAAARLGSSIDLDQCRAIRSSPRIPTMERGDSAMSDGETFYLGLVIVAVLAFSVTLAWATLRNG